VLDEGELDAAVTGGKAAFKANHHVQSSSVLFSDLDIERPEPDVVDATPIDDDLEATRSPDLNQPTPLRGCRSAAGYRR